MDKFTFVCLLRPEFIGSLIAGAASFFGQRSANKANIQQAREQMEFQAQQSSTAYQRAVADMRAAGLNPALAYEQGGASTPQGAKADIGSELGAAVQGASSGAQVENLLRQNELIKAQAEKTKAEEGEIKARTPVHAQHIQESVQRIEQSIAEIGRIRQETETSAASASVKYHEGQKIQQEINNLKALVNQITSATGKMDEETKDLQQRVKANLPAIQHELQQMELLFKHFERSGREVDLVTHRSFGGAVERVIRILKGTLPRH